MPSEGWGAGGIERFRLQASGGQLPKEELHQSQPIIPVWFPSVRSIQNEHM